MRRLDTRDPGFEPAFAALLDEARETTARVDGAVAAIIADVRARGDAALLDLTARYDRWQPASAAALRVTPEETAAAVAAIPAAQRDALALAARRIEAFHRAQMPRDVELSEPGIRTGMRWGALDAVGLYVPGGKAAYPSSVLMNALPARVAGVGRIAICVPTPDGVLNPLVLAAAHLAGVTEVFRIGGAQAVAALAWGTATVAPVDRITGPGNAYVAEAKRQVFGRVGIDSIAGPSEVVVIADAANDPRHVALDLLAQAEHDEAAQSILVTDDAGFADRVAPRSRRRWPPCRAPRSRARLAGAWRGDPGAGLGGGRGSDEPAGAGAPAGDGGGPRRAVRPHPPCGRRLPRPPLPGGAGRLRGGAEPRPAHRTHGALRLRPFGVRLPQAHDLGGGGRGGAGRCRPRRRGARAGRGAGCPCAERGGPADGGGDGALDLTGRAQAPMFRPARRPRSAATAPARLRPALDTVPFRIPVTVRMVHRDKGNACRKRT
jgi:histidinol dehydrogenase